MREGVVTEPREVQEQIASLGLTAEVLLEAVRMGEAARATCTENDPRYFPGQFAHARVVRGLREQLRPQGWKRNDKQNFSTVVRPDGFIRIAVATGNEDVANPDIAPKTKSTKGAVMEAAVASNTKQQWLPGFELDNPNPPDADDSADNTPIREDCQTWVLLFHRTNNKVLCELSLPEGLGEDMHLDAWKIRIILGSVDTDPTVILPLPDSGPDIDIQIVRK